MNPSRIFIMRPVATSLLMAAILLAGAVAYKQLAVSALPQVDYPTIQAVSFYPGAGPEVMASAVTAPLERQFGQMPGLRQMTSSSSGGSSVITLQFSLDLDLDIAEQEVQAAINAASNLLPTDLPNPPVYNKVNPADAPVLTLALTSKTLPLSRVEEPYRNAVRPAHIAGFGRGPGEHQRRTAARGAHPREPDCPGLLRFDPRRLERGHCFPKRQYGQGRLRRPSAILDYRRQRPDFLERRIPAAHRGLSKGRSRAAHRRGRGGRRR